MAVVPGRPDTVYAGNEFDGVYRSVDAAMTWEQVGPRFRCIYLVVDPANAARLYLIAEEGAFLSLAGGDTWERVLNASGEPIQEVEVITVDSRGQAYAGTSWRSVGDHLTHVYQAGLALPVTAIDPLDPDVVFTPSTSTESGRSSARKMAGTLGPRSLCTFLSHCDSQVTLEVTERTGFWREAVRRESLRQVGIRNYSMFVRFDGFLVAHMAGVDSTHQATGEDTGK